MSRSALSVALLFSIVSGLYWYVVGQMLPILVPMMLDNGVMLGQVLTKTIVALAVYVALATVFFRWLISLPR